MNPCIHLPMHASMPPLIHPSMFYHLATAVTHDQVRGYRYTVGAPSLEQRVGQASKQASKLTSLGSSTYSRSRVVEKQQRRVSPGLLLLMSTL